jgi:RNA polymerase sigma-70 factor (ECF subfamily)
MKHFTAEFIGECRKGNSKMQKQLFENLYAPMFRICHRYTGQHADAEDCLMKGFMKVFQNLDKFRFDGDASLFIWVRKIMVNECLMFIRQKHNFFLSIEDQFADVSIPAEIISTIDAEELNQLVLSLPAGYRTVFNLNVVEGYDHSEIASMLGISESTSRTQLAKARAKLKLLLMQKSTSHEKQGR